MLNGTSVYYVFTGGSNTMLKRITAFILCALVVLSCFVGCGSEINEDNPGAYINMYLADEIYNFDPAYAHTNDSVMRIASLIFVPLFSLEEGGKIKNELVESYTIYEDAKAHEYKMTLKLKTTYWSDGTQVSANDVVYSWKRILEVENTSEAAALLYDIKNARKVKEGDLSIDDLRVYAQNVTTVDIYFEEKLDAKGAPAIDYDGFIRNLTSFALVPLREMIVGRTDDWAKKPATMVCSGPFTLRRVSYEDESKGLILERNPYYMRNKEVDKLDKAVTPYRITVDFTKSEADIAAAYEAGEIFYMGEIPMSVRSDYADKAVVEDVMSTHAYYLNEKATIGDKQLFADPAVRQALSLAIDREAIAKAVVFAKAATALVPYTVYEAGSGKTDFRTVGGNLIATSADLSAAKSKLSAAGVDASKYSFAIMVAAYDEVHVAIAEMVAAAWNELGFKVTVDAVDVIVNDDLGTTEEVAKDIRDDIFMERYAANDYAVAAIDLVSYSTDAFGVLAPFAKGFTGQAMDMDLRDENNQPYYVLPTHRTGFDNEEYNALIEKAYATVSLTEKAAILHDAEKMLMDNMPVIPIIFNQSAKMISKDLSAYKTSYYGVESFTNVKLKDYENYIPVEE